MEAGDQPLVIGLELVNEDPIGQAFDLPGGAPIAIRPPFQAFGLQCLVGTKPITPAKAAFDAWIEAVVGDGKDTVDEEIENRWNTGEDIAQPMAMDAWQEGDWMVFQLSFLEGQP